MEKNSSQKNQELFTQVEESCQILLESFVLDFDRKLLDVGSARWKVQDPMGSYKILVWEFDTALIMNGTDRQCLLS